MNILHSLRSLFKYNSNIVILTLFQCAISIQMSISDNWDISYTIFNLVFSCASLIALFALLNTLLSLTGRKRGLVVNLIVTAIYIGLQSYHIVRHEALSFLLIYKNGKDLFHVEGLKFVMGNISVIGWVAIVVGIVALIALQVKLKFFNTFYKPQMFLRTVIVLIVCNVVLLFSVSGASNEYVEFFTSAYRYFNPDEIATFDELDSRGLYPYLKTVEQGDERLITNDTTKPHVFIVMLESFSAFYMDRVENGKKVTPFLDSLKDHGVYVKDFFSASVETSKGQFATLCSVYPSFRANVFTSYYKNNYNCLSHILKENGYTNVFLKAYHSLGFENTGTFVSNNAFDYYHGMDKNFVTKEERKKYKIGWGIQDDIFYKKTFEYLDTLKTKDSKPFFVTTMSVTNHMMFNKIPDDQEYVFPKASSHHENYTNSMYLTDKYLREFFKQLDAREYLKNSLVVVIGDNGFPMGQHRNNYHNTKTAYNEMFKMPMLVLWNGKLAPAVLEESAYSQLDVAPTVMDLLGINMTNHFVGTSIFASRPDDYFVPLVQPFDGTYLSSIRYPYKLIKHLRDGKEELYDLEKDMAEKQNKISSHRNSKIVKEMRNDIDKLRYNELLLKEDRIFSRGASNSFRIRLPEKRVDLGDDVPFVIVGDLKPEHTILVTSQYTDAYSNVKSIDSVVIKPQDDDGISASLFKPGINRLTFIVSVNDTIQFKRSEDVYVASNQSELISEMDITGKQGWGSLKINSSVRGSEMKVGGNRYEFGLGTHTNSDYRIELNKEYAIFHTWFGMDDEAQCGDGATFEIWGDAEKLYSSKQVKHRSLKETIVPVAGVQTLRLKTLRGKKGSCDHSEWINPVLFKALNEKMQQIMETSVKVLSKVDDGKPILFSIDSKIDETFQVNIRNTSNRKSHKNNYGVGKYKIESKSLLSPGFNTLVITVKYQNEIVHKRIEDVLYKTDAIELLQKIKAVGSQGYGKLRIGKTVKKKPLTIDGREYRYGFGSHANSDYVFEIGGGYSRFKTGAGLDDESSCGDGVEFEVLGDGNSLYKSGVIKNFKRKNVSVDVSGVQQLQLKIDQNKNRKCDHADWVNSVLLK